MFHMFKTINVPFLRMVVLLSMLTLIASPSWATPSVEENFPSQSHHDVKKHMDPTKRANGNNAVLPNRIWPGFWEAKQKDMEWKNFQKEMPTSSTLPLETDKDKNETEKVESPLHANTNFSSFWKEKERDLEGKSFHEEMSTASTPSPQAGRHKNKTEGVESTLRPYPVWSGFWEGKERDMEGENFRKDESTSTVSSSLQNVPSPSSPVTTVSDTRSNKNETRFPETDATKKDLAVDHLDWDAQEWVEMWENAINHRPQKQDSGKSHKEKELSTENPPVSTNTVASRTFKKLTSLPETESVVPDPETSLIVPSIPSTTDEINESYSKWDAEKWITMREKAINPASQRKVTVKSESDTVASETPLTSHYMERSDTSPLPFSSPRDEDVMNDHPDWDVENWLEFWENIIKNESQTPISEMQENEINNPKPNYNPDIPQATQDEDMQQNDNEFNATDAIKLWDDALKNDAAHQVPGKERSYSLVQNHHSSSTHASNAVHDETTVGSGLVSQKQNKDEENQPQETSEFLGEQDPGLNIGNLNHSEPERKVLHTSNTFGNILQNRLKVESGQIFELRDGTKMPADDGHSSESDDKKISMVVFTALIGAFCVVLAVLICAFIFCLCCKKQAKTLSEKNKSLTTLNTDGNRIDLQVLRPSQKSVDAFIFGLPIPTVDETLRTVVVDPPHLKY